MSTVGSHAVTHRLLDALRPLVRFSARGLEQENVFVWSTRRGPLRMVHFQLPDGTVSVNLFASMCEGRFSGVIEATPRLGEGMESQAQAARLAEYFLNAGDAIVPVGAGVLETKFSAGTHSLTLTNNWGRELARASITVKPLPAIGSSPVVNVPPRAQAGEPVAIEAPLFDGRLSTSSVAIDGRLNRILAVNERAAITALDEGLVGSVPLAVHGARGRLVASIRAVRVTLECARTELACGESGSIAVAVEGANDQETVALCNHAPGVVSLAHAESFTVTVPPGQVQRLRLNTLRSGAFAVTARLDLHECDATGSMRSMHAAAITGRVRDVVD
ncbi:MAG: hypothetical protein U0V87_03925 [Acidobacteriota bacterium]